MSEANTGRAIGFSCTAAKEMCIRDSMYRTIRQKHTNYKEVYQYGEKKYDGD